MINENTIRIGRRYKVIKNCERSGIPDLTGTVGICKWANYRGACLVFPDNMIYVILYDCLTEVDEKPKIAFRSIPTFETAVSHQFRYRLSKLPNDGIDLIGKVGKICKIGIVSRMVNISQAEFENGEKLLVPLECLEDVGT
jgi:hypothetical protein